MDNTVSTQTGATATFTWGTTATSVGRQVRMREISIAPANCQSPYFTQNITINPLPTKQTITGETAVCVGEIESYSIPNTVGSTYTWKAGTTTVGTGNPANITWATAGTFTLTVEETNANGCKQTHDIPFTVIVTPLPTPIITGTNAGICANTTHTYTVAVINNTNTHTWTVTNGTINSGQGTASISVTWDNVATGTISVVETTPATASCAGTSPLFTVNMSVAPLQPDIAGTTVTGNTGAVCENSTHTYNATAPVSGTDTYTWEVTGGQIDGTLATKSGVGLGNVSVTWGSAGAGTLKLRRISPAPANCSSTDDLVNITINALPATPTFAPLTATCSGSTVTYTVTGGSGTFEWEFTNVDNTVTNQTGNTVNYTWGTTATAVSRQVRVREVSLAPASCAGAYFTQNITVNPTPIITSITPITNTCGTSAVSYTITGTGLTGATFDWTVTNGTPAITTNGTSSLTITWNDVTALTTGVISVVPKTSSCTGTAFVQNININPLPANQIVTGAAVVCLNSTEAYSLTGSVLSNYTWVVTSTTAGIASPASGTGATASIQWQQVGTATVEFEETILATGCKKKHTRAITINTTPTTPVIIGGTTVCQNGSSTFSVSNPNNYTVLWEALTGGAINGANNGNTVTIDWTGTGTGSLRLTLSAGSCSANSTQTVTIIAPPNVNFTPVFTEVCLGQNTTHIAPDPPVGQVYEYTWTTNGGTIISGANAKTLVTRWNLNNGTEYVRLTIKVAGTNCEVTSPLPATPTDLGFVTVNPLPAPDVTGDYLVCPSEVVNYTTANVAGHTYIWSVINGTAVPTGNNVAVTWNSTAGAGKVIVIQTITATGCLQSDTLNVTISPLPAVPTSPDRSVCNPPKTIDLNATSAGATNYTWYDTATGGTTVASTQIYSPNITTNISFWVSATNAAGCESGRKEVKITVNPASTDLVITPTLVNADSCVASGDSPSGKIILALQGSNAPYTFVWTKAGVPAFTATTQNLTALTRGDYQVTITDAGGCTTVSPVYTILEQLKQMQDAKIIHENVTLADNQQIIIPAGLQTNLKAQGTDAVKFEWKDATGAVVSTNQTYTFTPNQEGDATYTVTVTNDRNCSMTRIVRVKVVKLTADVPNIFTPNNDSRNDKLQVYGNGIKSVN
ncbi:MAG: hypothetical protein EAY75_04200, partial [Bacteroidetes bacterium]